MIREIVHSIALIPDPITRSVYTKEISKEFDIDESIVINELNKTKKNHLAKELNEPQIASNPELTDTFVEPTPQTSTKKDPYPYEEYDLIRILIKYGPIALSVEHIDEHGGNQKVEVSVAELIHHELNKDGLGFSYDLFQRIYLHTIEGLEKKTLYKTSYWLKHSDQEIVQWVSEIESDEHELSPQWLLKYNVDTNREIDKIKMTVMGGIYAFKNFRVMSRIKEIRVEIGLIDANDHEKLNDLISEQIILERVKMSIAAKLGRTIMQ
jgi:DNA primase